MSNPSATDVSTPMPRFAVGTKVRVKPGIPDPDFPDFPMGGWAGVVSAVEFDEQNLPVYLIEWSDETLEAAHPVYFRRCKNEDLDSDTTWLPEEELIEDDGSELKLEQPTHLVPLPLDLDDPYDRIRSIFGLTSDDETPDLDEASLKRLHEWLAERLRFPFTAVDRNLNPLLVHRLLPLEDADEEHGLLIEVSAEGDKRWTMPLHHLDDSPGAVADRDLEAYVIWASDYLDVLDEKDGLDLQAPLATGGTILVLSTILIGAALQTLEGALLSVQVGAALLGLVGAFLGAGVESISRRLGRLPPGMFGGVVFGLTVGAVLGGALGVMVIAFVGTIPGAILGRAWVAFQTWRRGKTQGGMRVTLACSWIGGLAYAFWFDPWTATTGALQGLLVGVLLCVVGYFGFLGYLAMVLRNSGPES